MGLSEMGTSMQMNVLGGFTLTYAVPWTSPHWVGIGTSAFLSMTSQDTFGIVLLLINPTSVNGS